MSIEKELMDRSGSICELCSSKESLSVYNVPPASDGSADQSVMICGKCKEQIENSDKVDPNHWRCLNESMWSQVPAVQVIAWRMLNQLRSEGWPQDLLDMLYLEGDVKEWAEAMDKEAETMVKHYDSNGALLNAGDAVTLTKDLNVKGTSFTAKRGAVVRNISLVHDNGEQIEGRVNGQKIVILTKFVKKS